MTHVHAIKDHFSNLEEIALAIKNAGLEKSQLIFGKNNFIYAIYIISLGVYLEIIILNEVNL